MPRRSCRLSAFVRSSPLSNRVRSFVLIAFVLLTALSLPPRVRGTSYSDVFPAALSNYAFGGWQGPFGDGTAGRLFPTSDGTGIYADATYNGLVWILRSSPEFSSIDMTMHFSIPNRDFTDADYFALLLILHSPTTPSSTPPGTNCDGTCSYVAGQSGFKLLYRIGFNQLVITNGPGNVTLSQVSLPPVALNQPHDARATYAAGNLTVYLDSVQLATLQIPNVPPGQIGFETYRTDLIVNTITLVGSPVPGFALSVNPASATIVSGSSTNATMIVASVSGFSGTVALSATTLTSSLTASLNPSSLVLAPGSILTSTLTVNASSFCGNQTVTVTGTSGSATGSVTFTVTGHCTFDFSLADSPATLTIVQGGPSGVETATATLLTGLTSSIAFSVTTPLPTGVTASVFTPASCSPTCSATVTLTASITAPGSTTTLSIQAPGGAGETETVSATLVAGVAPSVTFSITSPLPTGVGASAFTPVSCIPTCSATVMLTASSTAPGSNTTMTIQATGGGITRTTTFNLVVTCGTGGAFDVCLATTPPTLTIFPGGPGGVETVATTLLAGSTTPMTFSIPNPLPPGVTASAFTPVSCNPTCSATVSLTASSTAPFDTSTVVTISATGGGLTRTATFTLFVVQGISADYSLSVAPTSVTLVPGTTSAASIVSALALVAGVQPVTLSISGLPTGVTASAFTPNPITPASPAATSMFSLTDAATAPVVAGVTITITGTSVGGLVRTTTFTLNVVASFDYSLSVAPTTVSLAPGTTSAPSTVSALLVATGAGVQTVTLSLSGLPTGVTASAFTPNPVTPASPAA